MFSEQEPPPLPAETPAREMNAGEFWVGGNWIADAGGFSWVPGRIERERPGSLFCSAGWVDSPDGWAFTPERWR